MRLVIVFLAACAAAFAGTVDVSVQCDWDSSSVTSEGVWSASCAGPSVSASGDINPLGSAETSASAGYYPFGNIAFASTSFTADYVLSWTGGPGTVFVEPLVFGYGNYDTLTFDADAFVSISINNSPWCQAGFPGTNNCYAIEASAPLTLTFSVSTEASASFTSGQPGEGSNGVTWGGFEFFNAQGQPLSGITYTFTEIPEPGTLPLLTGIACAALIAFKRRRKT